MNLFRLLLMTAVCATCKAIQYKTWNISSCPVVNESCRPDVITESKCDRICDRKGCTIRVGIILPISSYYVVNALAAKKELKSAEEAARNQSLLRKEIKIHYELFNDNCTQSEATIATIDAYSRFCAHVAFGSICDYSLASSARIVKYLGNYGMPLITAGGFSFDFVKQKTHCKDEFFMLVNSGIADYLSFGEFLILILRKYNWRKISLMYQKSDQNEIGGDQSCQLLLKTVIEVKKNNKYDMNFHDGDLEISRLSYEEYLRQEVGVSYGIIVVCANQTNTRKILLEAEKLGMIDSGEYLFLAFEMYNNYPKPSQPWFDPLDLPERNERARRAYKALLTFAPLIEEADVESNDTFVATPESAYLDSMYDGFLLFLHSLNAVLDQKSLTVNTTLRGIDLVSNMYGQTFVGKRGQKVVINCNGQRVANYALLQIDADDNLHIVANYSTLTKTMHSVRDIAWIKGSPPPDIPICGYDYSKCPPKINKWIVHISIIGVTLLVTSAVILLRRYKVEAEIAAMIWKIKSTDVEIIQKLSPTGFQAKTLKKNESQMNISKKSESHSNICSFAGVGRYNKLEVAVKEISMPNSHLKSSFKRTELKELKNMKDLSHPHLAKLFGVAVDPHRFLIITEYCPKGSLFDVLKNKEVQMDMMLQLSLLWDIVQGMYFLHGDLKIMHGALKSKNCLLDNHFAVKITDFGLTFLRKYSHECKGHKDPSSQLWTAPELLRNDDVGTIKGTIKGDVYSFAIVMHEIFTRKGPFFIPEYKEAEEIVQMVKKGLEPPFRPHYDQVDYEDAILKLMQDCWHEDEWERPDFSILNNSFREINSAKGYNNGSLLDNLLSRMEQYANNLETLVQDRTADYLEEKRKCEELLYQLLPKSVARQLIRKNSVIAETYEQVTIYFSDIAGFTSLSAQSTPLQVVHLLNDLYTCFDKVIGDFNVYKVETIGDAYMVVSGLPERNGDRHASEIAHMSLKLLEKVKRFKITHRPNEPLKLRIGIHTGPCVAGVVGLKMPRYCLFGDTVNTASRMESNGLPLKIHISSDTKRVLEKFNQFDLECRGEIDIKGKGKMTTYWLNGLKNLNLSEKLSSNSEKQVHVGSVKLISPAVLQNCIENDNFHELDQPSASTPLLSIHIKK